MIAIHMEAAELEFLAPAASEGKEMSSWTPGPSILNMHDEMGAAVAGNYTGIFSAQVYVIGGSGDSGDGRR